MFELFNEQQTAVLFEQLDRLINFRAGKTSTDDALIRLADKLLSLEEENTSTALSEEEQGLLRQGPQRNPTQVDIATTFGYSIDESEIKNHRLFSYMILLRFYPIFFTEYNRANFIDKEIPLKQWLSNLNIELTVDDDLNYLSLKVHDKHLIPKDLKRYKSGTALDLNTIMSLTKNELTGLLEEGLPTDVTYQFVANQHLFQETLLIQTKNKAPFQELDILLIVAFFQNCQVKLQVKCPEKIIQAAKILKKEVSAPLRLLIYQGLKMEEELAEFKEKTTPKPGFFQRQLDDLSGSSAPAYECR